MGESLLINHYGSTFTPTSLQTALNPVGVTIPSISNEIRQHSYHTEEALASYALETINHQEWHNYYPHSITGTSISNAHASSAAIHAQGGNISQTGIREQNPTKKKYKRKRKADEGPPKKRERNPDNWTRVILSKDYNTGQRKKINGEVRPRQVRGVCNDPLKCRIKCTDKVTPLQQEMLNNMFWQLGSFTKRREYMKSHVFQFEKNRPRVKFQVPQRNRQFSYKYFVTLNDEQIQVCKKFFLNTFDVSDHMVHRGSTCMIIPGGRKPKRVPKDLPSKEQENATKVHIRKYLIGTVSKSPKVREKEPHLTVSEMYKHYKTWFKDRNYEESAKVGKPVYRKIFLQGIKMGFLVTGPMPKKLEPTIHTGSERASSPNDNESLETRNDNQVDENSEFEDLNMDKDGCTTLNQNANGRDSNSTHQTSKRKKQKTKDWDASSAIDEDNENSDADYHLSDEFGDSSSSHSFQEAPCSSMNLRSKKLVTRKGWAKKRVTSIKKKNAKVSTCRNGSKAKLNNSKVGSLTNALNKQLTPSKKSLSQIGSKNLSTPNSQDLTETTAVRSVIRSNPNSRIYSEINQESSPILSKTTDDISQHTSLNSSNETNHPLPSNQNLCIRIKTSRGEIRPRTVRGACSVPLKCRQKCTQNISPSQQSLLNSTFWELDSLEKRRLYLSSQITRYEKKTSTLSLGQRDRKYSYNYCFDINGNRINVCKSFFVNTLGITDSVIHDATEHLPVSTISTFDNKLRSPANKTKPESVELVKTHINVFLGAVNYNKSILGDTNSERKEEPVNITEMYRKYDDWFGKCNFHEYLKVKQHMYRKIYHESISSNTGTCSLDAGSPTSTCTAISSVNMGTRPTVIS